jgi:hypothetical protein
MPDPATRQLPQRPPDGPLHGEFAFFADHAAGARAAEQLAALRAVVALSEARERDFAPGEFPEPLLDAARVFLARALTGINLARDAAIATVAYTWREQLRAGVIDVGREPSPPAEPPFSAPAAATDAPAPTFARAEARAGLAHGAAPAYVARSVERPNYFEEFPEEAVRHADSFGAGQRRRKAPALFY